MQTSMRQQVKHMTIPDNDLRKLRAINTLLKQKLNQTQVNIIKINKQEHIKNYGNQTKRKNTLNGKT